MLLAALSMILSRRDIEDRAQDSQVGLAMFQGLLVGFLTGLVGAGGGFLIIPALVFLTRLPFKTAVGTSLFVIAINALTGFVGDVFNTTINWPFLLSITALATVGIFLGNSLARRLSTFNLRKAFGWFVLIIATLILLREGLLF